MVKVVVFEYGAGNVHSACHALERAGATVELTDDAAKVRRADGVLVPGVGAFGYVMNRFQKHGGQELICERAGQNKPLFGVCVGMQILFQSATEKGHHNGLGFFSGEVSELPAQRLPNMGWAQVSAPEHSRMFTGIEESYFYFVHSFARQLTQSADNQIDNLVAPGQPVEIAVAEHGAPFVAAIESGNLWATQFHPEKSGESGLKLLSNWLETL